LAEVFLTPGIVNVDVTPAVVDKAGSAQGAGAAQDFVGVHLAAPAVPTVPTRRRREGDGVAGDDLEFLFSGAEGVFGAEKEGRPSG
jgi:hypothetical protein